MLNRLFRIIVSALSVAVTIALTQQPAIAAEVSPETVLVEFDLQGRPFRILGEKTGPHTYLFNKGAAKKLIITTLDWKPYIGETICGQGWVQQVTIALLAVKGYEIESKFLPWARTIAMAETGQADILYPEYYIEPKAPSDVIKESYRLDNLALSKKIPGGPIVFIKRKNEPGHYHGNLNNLANEKIGVVRGYQNTPEFDALMDTGFFEISKAVDDFMNVKKLVNRRVNLIIGDPIVLFFSIMTQPSTTIDKDRLLSGIEIVEPVIQYNHLYYAVSKKKPGWQKTLEDLNDAIHLFETTGLMIEIIQKSTTECGFNMDAVLRPYLKE